MQSWAGSLACVAGGFFAVSFFILYFSYLGYLPEIGNISYAGAGVLAVAIVGGLVESLAIETWDNVTVSLSVAAASYKLL